MKRKKIFYLEDNPESAQAASSLRNDGHDVILASNINKAAQILQFEHDPTSFDKFFFDVEMSGGKIFYPKVNEMVEYSSLLHNANGLYFLLHNLKHFGNRTNLANYVAIITAHANRIRITPVLNVFGTEFVRKQLSKEQENIIHEKGCCSQVWYEVLGQSTYTFSLLDKAENDIAMQIDRFISQ
jgi:CheY-like chemotaxis protein